MDCLQQSAFDMPIARLFLAFDFKKAML